MLKSSQRLSTAGFEAVIEKGRAVHSPLFLLRVLRNGSGTHISAIAPKKVAKTAVSRNKIRRRIYSALKSLYPSLAGGTQAIVSAKTASTKESIAALTDELKGLFVKAGVLK